MFNTARAVQFTKQNGLTTAEQAEAEILALKDVLEICPGSTIDGRSVVNDALIEIGLPELQTLTGLVDNAEPDFAELGRFVWEKVIKPHALSVADERGYLTKAELRVLAPREED